MAFVNVPSLWQQRSKTFEANNIQTQKQRPPRQYVRKSIAPRMTISTRQKTINLRKLLNEDRLHLMPCCYDGLSAKLVQRADFDLTFLSGFATAGAHGLPDTGLLSSYHVETQIAQATAVIDIPLIADGDTGFGNPINVFQTVTSFTRAGASGILIEDQVNPKRYVTIIHLFTKSI